MNPQGEVYLNGTRYDYSGKTFPHFASWIETFGLDFSDRILPQTQMPVDPPRMHPEFFSSLSSCTVHQTQEDTERIFHSHGHTLQEMHALKFGKIDRVVDIVAYPGSEQDVQRIMELAAQHNILLVPFGGGTNVTHSLQIDKNENRVVCSVDMTKMNKVLDVNMRSMTATVEAGIAGKDLEEALKKYGVCCGHEPDSVEFSTLGGWISTRASGMRKNIYGNIEDIVITIRIVTPIGVMERPCSAPRVSTGPDSNNLIIGHEGLFGIITQALIKVKFLPEVKDYDSIIFPSFEIGAEFMYECGVRQVRPASIRLMDNEQFRFGLALKPAEDSSFKAFIDSVKKFYVTRVKGFEPERMAVCTLVFEGSKEQVFMQRRHVLSIAAKYKGLVAGAENGRRGYFLTYTIAYIRDFGMEFYLYAESFEASVPWDKLQKFLKNVPVRHI